jgi:hypothetical protein
MKNNTGINHDELIRNLTEAMTRIDLNNYRDKTNQGILESPFKYLPDCSEFSISLGTLDPHLLSLGLLKKTAPKISIKGGLTSHMNRYLEHQVRRLLRCVQTGNSKLFWRIAQAMMKRSNTLRVSAFHRVAFNWHRIYPLSQIYAWNRKVSNIINNGLDNIESKRVYINKPNGGVRPLGVPAMEWRILLHMYNLFLTMWIQPHLSKSQHGFQPHKGTLTAWKAFFRDRLFEKAYIHEYDFKGFFDNINLKSISRKLELLGVPFEIFNFLETLNRKAPTNNYPVEMQTLMDKRLALREETTQLLYSGQELPYTTLKLLLEELKLSWPSARTLRSNDCTSIQEYIQLMWALQDDPTNGAIDVDLFNRGVGQGYPTSPILSMLVMENWLRPEYRIVSPPHADLEFLAYADDSIAFSDHDFKLDTPIDPTVSALVPLESFIIKPEGSGWVKRAGKWLKPLKFLGLVFDGTSLKSETRNGKSLTLSPNVEHAVRLIEMKKFETIVMKMISKEIISIRKSASIPADSWSQMLKTSRSSSIARVFQSKLAGFIQARLYNGSWNLAGLEQDFNLTFVHKSWCSKNLARTLTKSGRTMTIFTSSSFASLSLCEIFRQQSKIRRQRSLLKPGTRLKITKN